MASKIFQGKNLMGDMNYLRHSNSIPHRKPHTQLWLMPLTGDAGTSPMGTVLAAGGRESYTHGATKNSAIGGAVAAAPGGFDSCSASIIVASML